MTKEKLEAAMILHYAKKESDMLAEIRACAQPAINKLYDAFFRADFETRLKAEELLGEMFGKTS